MRLKVITWNLRRAGQNSQAWMIIRETHPYLIILQEVVSIPEDIKKTYSYISEKATSKNGKYQIFHSVILWNGKINHRIFLKSEYEWINKELDFFKGNLIGCNIEVQNQLNINVISVYSPAWPVDKGRLQNIDVSSIKLKQNPQLWCTEILWAGLKTRINLENENWIVAGDFNSSVTFDFVWGKKPRGNQEIIDRMNSIGLTDCLLNHSGKLIPTFKNPKNGKVIHQLDHMYVSKPLLQLVTNSCVGDPTRIFDNSISDHLPIITDFEIKKLLTIPKEHSNIS